MAWPFRDLRNEFGGEVRYYSDEPRMPQQSSMLMPPSYSDESRMPQQSNMRMPSSMESRSCSISSAEITDLLTRWLCPLVTLMEMSPHSQKHQNESLSLFIAATDQLAFPSVWFILVTPMQF